MKQPEANKTNLRALRPKPGTAGAVWVECPYPLVTLGLQQTLQAAGYHVRSDREDVVEGETPSAVIYCPRDEDVTEDVVGRIERLRRTFPEAPVLVVGLNASHPALARAALRGGARGFLHLGMQPSQVARAISVASEGETVFPRELVTGLISEEEPPDLQALTARQREILELAAHGLTNAEIARRLFLTEGTVKQYLRAAYKALGVGSRVQAARILGCFGE